MTGSWPSRFYCSDAENWIFCVLEMEGDWAGLGYSFLRNPGSCIWFVRESRKEELGGSCLPYEHAGPGMLVFPDILRARLNLMTKSSSSAHSDPGIGSGWTQALSSPMGIRPLHHRRKTDDRFTTTHDVPTTRTPMMTI